jgi:hypothetical protein
MTLRSMHLDAVTNLSLLGYISSFKKGTWKVFTTITVLNVANETVNVNVRSIIV